MPTVKTNLPTRLADEVVVEEDGDVSGGHEGVVRGVDGLALSLSGPSARGHLHEGLEDQVFVCCVRTVPGGKRWSPWMGRRSAGTWRARWSPRSSLSEAYDPT